VLHAENVPVPEIAKAVGTPFYVYSTATLERHYKVFAKAFADVDAMVCYAMKANSNQAVLKTLARSAPGIDVVSGGELRGRWPPACRKPHHVLRRRQDRAEMDLALEAGIYCFNVESEPELEVLSSGRSARYRRTAHVSFRINPDVDARTHAKISTGKKENKFGISYERARAVYARAARCPASKVTASTCISAARSPICSRSRTPSGCCANSWIRCAPTATGSTMSISAAASASPTGRQ
jgi:diaminopimelate decarboxylase